MGRNVVVGVDGSSSSSAALLWAARAAHDRHAPLDLVHALGHPMTALELTYYAELREGAEELLEKAAGRVRESWPGTQVRVHVDAAPVAPALAERSRSAALVVVGARRGLGGVARVLTGTHSYAVAAASWCPVAVVPRLPDEESSGVYVGVDGSPDSVLAVAVAADEADRIGQELHVVHAWQRPEDAMGADYFAPTYKQTALDLEHVVLGESVAGLAAEHPDLRVHQRLVRGHPAAALVDVASAAQLLVIGSHGRSALARGLLGSVSHAVVNQAVCPVMVARARHHVQVEHA